MKIFISHSLARSRALAEQTEWFLRQLFPGTTPWASTGIDKGANWDNEIGASLQDAVAGVVCLTQENLDERWVLFEAGALAKQFGTRVCTLLLDVRHEDVKPPLNKFQHTTADREEVLKLVESINKVAKEHGKDRIEGDLREAFGLYWPKLEATIKGLRDQGPPAGTASPSRSPEDMMTEVLSTVREVTNYVSVMFDRQEKMLLLAKEEYRAVAREEAPSLRALRNRAAHTAADDLKTALIKQILVGNVEASWRALLRAADRPSESPDATDSTSEPEEPRED